MSENQKRAFWSMFLVFVIVGTASIYLQDAFQYTDTIIGAAILTGFYLLVGFFIFLFVKKNPKEIDTWFKR